MTITKPVKKKAVEDFIGGAPDAQADADAPRRVRKGKKVQITLTISEPMLQRVDERAAQLGQSRAAVINLAIAQTLESGLRIGGERAAT